MIKVRDSCSKFSESFKAYILVFTCAITQCTHLELVTDVTIETLILRLNNLFLEEKSHFS